jgi:MKL/myocardin-like protein
LFLGHVDGRLAEKVRMLEKAILVDQLNSKISHRPGPLELIEKNILHTNEPIEKIVKEGLLPFKVGSEEELAEKNFLSFEDDSQSSEGDLFQANASQIHPEIKKESDDIRINEIQGKQFFEALPSSSNGNIINISLVPSSNLLATSSVPISVGTYEISTTINIPNPPPPPPLELITYHVKPVKGIINTQSFLPIQITETPITTTILSTPNLLPVQTQMQTQTVNQHVSSFIQNNQAQKYSAPGKERGNRKKCKNKAVSKRPLKFHEYLPKQIPGPANKNSSQTKTVAGETNFDLIMQQQCLLEYLENIYKNPHIKSESESLKHPIKQFKIENEEDAEKSLKTFNKPHITTIFPSKPQSSTSSVSEISKDSNMSDVTKLTKMKVSELKAYLKMKNLPVSGPKGLLIERLKPYLPLPLKPFENNDESLEGNDFYNSSLHSVSSTESEMDGSMDAQFSVVSSSSKDEDIVADQQRKIEELQRKLQQSQQELEQIKQNKIIEPQFQMPAVFVVDIQTTPDDDSGKSKTPMLLNANSSLSSQIESEIQLSKDNEPSSSNQIDKETANPPLPMSQEQDISDVLEILLKNGEWPEISDGSFNHNSNESDNTFIENVLSGQVMSPMAGESIDKILGEF